VGKIVWQSRLDGRTYNRLRGWRFCLVFSDAVLESTESLVFVGREMVHWTNGQPRCLHYPGSSPPVISGCPDNCSMSHLLHQHNLWAGDS
jgi:hypothetical protein